MNWIELNYYDIFKIKDEQLKKQYMAKYYFYIVNISGPIIESLKKQGLNFRYSKSVRKLTIKEMADELKQFCNQHEIDKKTVYEFVGLKR